MVLLTMIARVRDGLPLAASMQEDEQTGRSLTEYQNQAKLLFRKLNNQSPDRCTIETGKLLFHYLIDQNICYLVLCEASFSKKLAFSYLEELSSEFFVQYGNRVDSVARPYAFIEFDTYMQKTKKTYTDTRARRNLSLVSSELQDVQRIMVSNIDDVLQRGVALSELGDKASNLASLSKKYKQDAHYLNLRSSYAKIAAIVIVLVVAFLYIRYWWL
uniref:Vesicle-trafficking protein SEC22b n=1 Tax=Phallusia mammillata TaxID=59560 RepID=A0A6F9DR63_9ASCI|nr:vesicle-trafficking protein SEC22b [Phallusia mammillata]